MAAVADTELASRALSLELVKSLEDNESLLVLQAMPAAAVVVLLLLKLIPSMGMGGG